MRNGCSVVLPLPGARRMGLSRLDGRFRGADEPPGAARLFALSASQVTAWSSAGSRPGSAAGGPAAVARIVATG
jgi:hypothetical protein